MWSRPALVVTRMTLARVIRDVLDPDRKLGDRIVHHFVLHHEVLPGVKTLFRVV